MGVQILKELQYGPRSSSTLSFPQVQQLRVHGEVVRRVGGRRVPLRKPRHGQERQVLVLYSDAEYTEGRIPRLGGVGFVAGAAPFGFTHLLHPTHFAGWKPRLQHIFLAELTAVPCSRRSSVHAT